MDSATVVVSEEERRIRRRGGGGAGQSNAQVLSRYDLSTFLPRFLADQFSQPPNLYFLCVALLQQIPDFSPTGRWGTTTTLAGLLALSLLRTAGEDLRRRAADARVDRRRARRVRTEGQFEVARWRDLGPGDVVEMGRGERAPADMVLLSTSEPLSVCYLDTSPLDGETNLKLRQALPETSHLQTGREVESFAASLEVGPPSRDLNSFSATMTVLSSDSEGAPPLRIGLGQFVPRGSRMVNTEWALAAVVAVGSQTKQLLNARAELDRQRPPKYPPLRTSSEHGPPGSCCCSRRSEDSSAITTRKRSGFDREVNGVVVFLLAALVIACLGLAVGRVANCLLLPQIDGNSQQRNNHSVYILPEQTCPNFHNGIWQFHYDLLSVFVRFLILLHNVVPVSLLATVQLVRMARARALRKDQGLYSEEHKKAAEVQNSQLNEMLGKVKYVFADKTGTVTKNRLTFKKCWVSSCRLRVKGGGTELCLDSDSKDQADKIRSKVASCSCSRTRDMEQQQECCCFSRGGEGTPCLETRDLFLAICLCHTVIPHFDEQGKEVLIGCPDEKAVLEGSRAFGVASFSGREEGGLLSVQMSGERRPRRYRATQVTEYSSERKRMSVVAEPEREAEGGEEEDGDVLLICKGADAAVAPLLKRGAMEAAAGRKLKEFATAGLRTMCYAYRVVPKEELEAWRSRWERARATGGEEERERMAEEVERDLVFLGVTAVEDELQDNVVPAMSRLLSAGLRVWLLSGDRQENAVSVARSSGLLPPGAPVLLLPDCPLEESRSVLREHVSGFSRRRLSGRCNPVALVVSGATVGQARECPVLAGELWKLLRWSRTVICYRVNPSQKADVVRAVRSFSVEGDDADAAGGASCVTLAVGDGSNDVPMIRAAHIGVGISGIPREHVQVRGSEAAAAADYSVAEFSALPRLILVHGRWNASRGAKMVCYFFYKSVVFYAVQLWFSFFSGFTASSLFPRASLSLYNLAFTLLPPFAICLTGKEERNGNDSESEVKSDCEKRFLLWTDLAGWISLAVFQSAAVFFVTVFCFPPVDLDLSSAGQLCYTQVLAAASAEAAMEAAPSPLAQAMVWSGVAAWAAFCLAQNYLPVILVAHRSSSSSFFSFVGLSSSQQAGLAETQSSSATFWLLLLLVPLLCILPDLLLRAIKKGGRDLEVWRRLKREDRSPLYVDSVGERPLLEITPPSVGEEEKALEGEPAAAAAEEEEEEGEGESPSSALLRLSRTLPRSRSRAQLESLAGGFAFEPVDVCRRKEAGEGEGGSSQVVVEAYCRTMGGGRGKRRKTVGRRRPSDGSSKRSSSAHKRSKSAVV